MTDYTSLNPHCSKLAAISTKENNKGFTLAGLMVSLTVMAMCSVVAAFYYQAIIDDQAITRAKVKLHEVRSAYLIWQSRNPGAEPANINELDTLSGGAQARLDPWDNLIIIDVDQRVIVSMGPDGVLNGSVEAEGMDDDISEPLPPAPVSTAIDSDRYVQQQQLPVISTVYATGAVVKNPPDIGASYNGISAPVDTSTVWFTVNNENKASESRITKTSIEWKNKAPLASGKHSILLKIQDTNGNVCVRPWTFFIK